jgi:ubiquinone/menaquinone biosynthesis C-methylase UbiE
LEIGCGPGTFWEYNIDHLRPTLVPVLTDLSFGMVGAAKKLNDRKQIFNFSNSDSMNLPFERGRFDRVIANHMLYHVPDISRAIKEAARVMKPDGFFITATNGENHMRESFVLMSHLLPEFFSSPRIIRRFNLENGAAQLQESFHSVKLYLYEDSLQVTESQALVEYLVSIWGSYIDQTITNSLKNLIEHEIKAKGYFFIQKSAGIFISTNPK